MGRELQKKKNKSGIAKVRQKPKSQKKIVTNAVVAANWNQTQTLAQNYRRLGLASKLNHPSGGVEPPSQNKPGSISTTATSDPYARSSAATTTTLAITGKLPTALTPTLATIERDPATGHILRVLDPRPSPQPTTITPTHLWKPLHDPLTRVLSPSPPPSHPTLHPHADSTTAVIRHFESLAATPAPPKVRKQSAREEEWVRRLVERHGGGEGAYGAMCRDVELNVWQQSEGDIKRRVERWRGSGGGGGRVDVVVAG